MKRFAFLGILLLVGVGICRADNDWEELSDEDGIKVWKRDVPGSPIVALKGEAIVEAPVAKVASVLDDNSRDGEWVCSLVEAKVLRQISPTARIEYNHTHAPWPIKDRDFVFHAEVKADTSAKTLTYELRSIEDKLMPEDEDKAVRGELIDSRYILKADGNRTRLVVIIQADPRGSVPKWLVNLFQRAWPRETIEGIRAQCAKADVKELAAATAWLESGTAPVTSAAMKE